MAILSEVTTSVNRNFLHGAGKNLRVAHHTPSHPARGQRGNSWCVDGGLSTAQRQTLPPFLLSPTGRISLPSGSVGKLYHHRNQLLCGALGRGKETAHP